MHIHKRTYISLLDGKKRASWKEIALKHVNKYARVFFSAAIYHPYLQMLFIHFKIDVLPLYFSPSRRVCADVIVKSEQEG